MPPGPRDVQAHEFARTGHKHRQLLRLSGVRHEAGAIICRIRYGLGALIDYGEAAKHSDAPGEDTMTTLRSWRAGLAGVLLAGTIAPVALAQGWPDRPITAVVPFTAGAANDIVGRIALEQVSKQVNQPIVVENRPGAGGVTGANSVAKAAPNGYTILVHSSSFASSIALHKTLPYDTLNDFAPVLPLGNSPTVLVTSPSKGFKTVADLVAAAKAKPGAMNFASAGVGSTSHLAAERFRLSAGIEAQHVPFRGPNEAFTEVLAGRIDFYFLPLAPALPLVKEGQLTALAVSSEK